MDFEAKYLQLAAHIGFLATRNGLAEPGRAIFQGLKEFRPGQECPVIGLATADIAEGKFDTAIDILERDILAEDEENIHGLTYKALALHLSGQNNQAEQILTDLVDSSGNEGELEFAGQLLDSLND